MEGLESDKHVATVELVSKNANRRAIGDDDNDVHPNDIVGSMTMIDTPGVRNRYGSDDHEHDSDDGRIPHIQATHVDESSNKLSYWPLLAIIFYSVSGGPYGIESTVRAGGNFYALMGFLIGPLLWSLPEALMTAELSTSIPEASAGVAWVQEAFGTQAGWIFGYLAWISGATDNAIYPVLFLDYLIQTIHGNDDIDEEGAPGSSSQHPILRFILLSTISIILSYINWLGLPLVGKMSVSICIISISPFIIMCIVGILWKGIDPSNWFIMPQDILVVGSGSNETIADDDFINDSSSGNGRFFFNPTFGGVLWRPYLNNLFWNLNSFDATGSFAEDVHNPSRLLPKALHWSVLIVAAGYFLPLLIAIGAATSNAASNQSDWVDGYLAVVVEEIAGPWLGTWTIFAAGISNIALFQAELSADSLALMGMAERGYLPKIFTTRSKHGTPTYGIIVCCIVIMLMSISSNLDKLIEMLNFNYGLSLLMEYVAFIKLRISKPNMSRPYRIPLNTFGCVIFFLPTIVVTIIVLALASYTTIVVSVVVNIAFMTIYYGKERKKQGIQNDGDIYERVGTMLDEFSMEQQVPGDDYDERNEIATHSSSDCMNIKTGIPA